MFLKFKSCPIYTFKILFCFIEYLLNNYECISLPALSNGFICTNNPQNNCNMLQNMYLKFNPKQFI